jgi:hypothetical protein
MKFCARSSANLAPKRSYNVVLCQITQNELNVEHLMRVDTIENPKGRLWIKSDKQSIEWSPSTRIAASS